MLKHVSDEKEFDGLVKGDKVLVDFYATWCGPCSMLAPIIEKVAKDHPELTVVKVDVDEAQGIAARFDVYSIPTLVYFEKGQKVRQDAGYRDEDSVKRFANIR
jgi:thioredoxin 1